MKYILCVRLFIVCLLMNGVLIVTFASSTLAQDNPMTAPNREADIDKSLNELNEILQLQMKSLDEGIADIKQGIQSEGAQSLPMSADLSQPQKIDLHSKIIIMSRYLKDDPKMLKNTEILCTQHGQKCIFLSEFWRVRALKSCQDFTRRIYEDMNNIDDLTDRQRAYFRSMVEQCTFAYYYDEWDRIAETIETALKKAK